MRVKLFCYKFYTLSFLVEGVVALMCHWYLSWIHEVFEIRNNVFIVYWIHWANDYAERGKATAFLIILMSFWGYGEGLRVSIYPAYASIDQVCVWTLSKKKVCLDKRRYSNKIVISVQLRGRFYFYSFRGDKVGINPETNML